MTIQGRYIKQKGPYKMLALDGGGIRGVISLAILARIEAMLQEALGRDEQFVLADYFDYIAGTSTGAIIAAALSLGMRVSRIQEFYLTTGKQMFDHAFILDQFRFKYNDFPLAKLLKDEFGADTTLGSEKLKTLLLLIMRNTTTDSAWPVSNNPYAKYNDRSRPDCNLAFPLWQLVRASTAAPTYFPPERIQVGKHDFIFVDGAVTTYNNPAFQLFLMATMEPYKLQWETGEKNMLIVSVGTGTSANANEKLQPNKMNLLFNAHSIPAALMYGALNEQDFLCRAFGACRYGEPLDREVGAMIGAKGPVDHKLFTYLRYNPALSAEGLTAMGLSDMKPASVQLLDSIEYLSDLQRVGEVASRQVHIDHFADFLA